MKRFVVSLLMFTSFTALYANQVDVIYNGPKDIGDWGTVELSSIKFHNLEMGDTIYVYVSQINANSKGSFQDHQWKAIPDVINGQTITGDFELVINSYSLLNQIKQFGLKVRGEDYRLEKIVIKHGNQVVQKIIMIASGIVLFAILLTLGILIWKNRQLSKINRQLYIRNMDVLAAVDEEKKMKTRYEGQIAALKEMIQNGVGGDSTKQKYQSSTLADDDKTLLQDRILSVFDTDEIFAEDFNMNKLATLVNSNYKNVSQVVNEMMGKNFNALLNEYRIKEACRRLSDVVHYGNYTIEAIGTELGYGSRSTFVTQFKASTGLAPSEFQKLAKEKANIH